MNYATIRGLRCAGAGFLINERCFPRTLSPAWRADSFVAGRLPETGRDTGALQEPLRDIVSGITVFDYSDRADSLAAGPAFIRVVLEPHEAGRDCIGYI